MISELSKSNNVIIIVNYNGSSDTIQCVESIEKSKADSSVVIVDNCSQQTDYNNLLKKCPRATIIRSEVNNGFAGGNNIGIKTALEYENIQNIILLNNDTEISSDAINFLLGAIKEGTIVTPKMMYYYDKNKVWYAGGYINKYTGRAIHRHINENNNSFKDKTRNCDFTSGCCMAFVRTDIEKIGLLEESYFMYCEDTEFCLRAVSYGLTIKYIPDAIIYHKVSQSTGGGESAFCLYYMTRNRLRYLHEYRKYFSFIAIPFTICTRIIRILQYMIKRDSRWKSIRKGIIDYYKNIQGEIDLKKQELSS